MKVYAVIYDWAYDYETDQPKVTLFEKYEDAMKKFDEYVADDKEFITNHRLTGIVTESEGDHYESYEEGYYVKTHTFVEIQQLNIN